MAIRKIIISNFKSFDHLDIDLDNFNILIGANASGKSNFITIFKFLRDMANYGLEDAISMQGGIGYLRNMNIGSAKNFSLEIISDETRPWLVQHLKWGFNLAIKNHGIDYKLDLGFKKKGLGFYIAEDILKFKCSFVKLRRKNQDLKDGENLGEGEIIFKNIKGRIEYDLSPKELPLTKEQIFPRMDLKEKLSPKSLLIESPYFFYPYRIQSLNSISINDFDPKLPKRAIPITGRAELEEDGSNLAVAIKNIIQDKEQYRKFSNFVRDLLPFVAEIDIEKFADKSLLVKLQEIYFKKQYMPASFISDGTLNIVSLILALFFDRKRTVIIEEPERNIHPYLISKVMEMMKDASRRKQIIATTHNAEIVRNAELQSILLISRNKSGFSSISRPSMKEEVKKFLENEIGIHDLFIQDLLK